MGDVLTQLATARGLSQPEGGWNLNGEIPPRLDLGDLAFPLFHLAKFFRGPPQVLAQDAAKSLLEFHGRNAAAVTAVGAYVNIFYLRPEVAAGVVDSVLTEGDGWGCSDAWKGQKIMLEFSCPNTNKPLHLGHLRNNALGMATSLILRSQGAEVKTVNLINDRGIHICKSMLAYVEGGGTSPESAHMKSDHYVGHWYVRYSQLFKEDPEAESRAQEMLRRWEACDTEVRGLWEKMNRWAIEGIVATYRRTGVSFDRTYKESETYLRGKTDILDGLERGVFFRRSDGAVVARLPWKESAEAEANAEKVLLRADGTSIYLTQDIGTALQRHEDWPFDRMVYVVASEQDYYFQSLFEILTQLGHVWARHLYHLSYGMVNLPEGRMKSREGTVVDADNLLDELAADALAEIKAKEREDEVGDSESTAEKIALGALHYFLLQVTPSKDMIFNPKESLNFNGNTGPYLQYTGARLTALRRKAPASNATPNWNAAVNDAEWDVVRELGRFPVVLAKAAAEYDPSQVASYLNSLARAYSRFYHDYPILGQEEGLSAARLALSEAVRVTLRNGMSLLNIPFLEVM